MDKIKLDLDDFFSKVQQNIKIDTIYDDIQIPDDSALEAITVPVNVGEKCTVRLAQNKQVFDKEHYIANLNDTEKANLNSFSSSLDNKTGNGVYQICNVDEEIAYENCAFALNNPYLSMNKDSKGLNNVCSLSTNTLLPENSKYSIKYHNSNTILLPETEIYFQNNKKAFCEGRWNDWFCLPNYHLNNKWYNDLPDELQQTKSVGNCYVPCDIGFVPSDTDPTKCVSKSEYLSGAYAQDFDYTPIALICLLGTTYDTFVDQKTGYVNYMEQIKKTIESEKEFDILRQTRGGQSSDAITAVLATVKRSDTNVIWQGVKNDIQSYIKKLFLHIKLDDDFLKNNIVPPSENVKTMLKAYLTKDKLLYAYSIAQMIKEKQSDDVEQYKDWRMKLQKVSDLPEPKFKFLLKILKQSCNICFDNKTPFSTDFILFSLNKDLSIDASAEAFHPISLDITYDPQDDEFVVKEFSPVKKMETGVFDDYKNYFRLYELSLYTYLQVIVIIIGFFIIYMLYIIFHSSVNKFINSIITFVIYRYYDIQYYVMRLFSKYVVDDREEKRLLLVKYYLQKFKDFDSLNYL